MKEYELTVLLAPEAEKDVEATLTKVKGVLTDNGGEVKSETNWGRKKLAYDIKKQDFATYVFMIVALPAEALVKVSGILNITDGVLRYLLVKKDIKADKRLAASKERAAKVVE
ncbi:MAG: 30S ribosomal protein S6 [Candidatus Nomurabacteria bacterium]|jgi:small subunit ribosomal protein S6|nr:30S ribosomal protein S6 [Candidatus Nomurabacteria bacterium]